ncbi:MAG TPA: tetratricopeptide repeat protein, partial [Chthonomonadales bacterium]|nr:tetratricopeptide repeat protein [Chthonomonadales bacterium]
MPDTQLTPCPLEIALLGSLLVRVHGRPLPRLSSRKGSSLLAFLTLKGNRPVERGFLSGTLWPDSTDSRALFNLRQCLSNLRHALGDQAYRLSSATPRTLCVDLSGAAVDVMEFDAAVAGNEIPSLERAIGLYRGPLLEDCSDDWVFLERQQREHDYLGALERLAQHALSIGRPAIAAVHLRKALAVDPLRESLQRALMQALADAGDYNAALLAYRMLRRLLSDGMHAEPDAITQGLYHQIRQQAERRSAPAPLTGTGRTALPAAVDRTATSTASSLDDPKWPNNLPFQPTSFIGRDADKVAVKQILASTTLLTLTGAGGCGKTRLALEVGTELREEYPDGVWLVELAPLAAPELVERTLLGVLGLREEPERTSTETAGAFLHSQQALLILDNCEHLVDTCAQMATALMRGCARLKILATSREPLRVPGESVWLVPALPVPDAQILRSEKAAWSTVLKYDACILLIERAKGHRPDLTLSSANAIWAARICERLDGIPLALELAAARVPVLTLEEIASRLDQRFRLLTSGSRTDLPRHRTLRALIDWSWDLLTQGEKHLLGRLSVFAGGWILEAAAAICSEPILKASGNADQTGPIESGSRLDMIRKAGAPGSMRQIAAARSGLGCTETPSTASALRHDDSIATLQRPEHRPIDDWEVLDLLSSLVDKSLVIAETSPGRIRYRLLETVRQYAREKLEEREEAAEVKTRHRDWFLAFAKEAGGKLRGPELATWLDRMDREHDNLRAALAWSVTNLREDATSALSLCGALCGFWELRGHIAEGRRWSDSVLKSHAGSGEPKELARALTGVGNLAREQSDYSSAQALYEQGLEVYREIGDRQGIAASLLGLGSVDFARGNHSSALGSYEHSLGIYREIGDRQGMAAALASVGNAAKSRGDYGAAREYYEQSLAIHREVGDRWGMANLLHNLGFVAADQGDSILARHYYQQSLELKREIRDPLSIALSLHNLGSELFRQGDYAAARDYHEQSLAIKREIGDRQRMSYSLLVLGNISAAQGDNHSAEDYQEQGLEIFREIGDRLGIATALSNLGNLAIADGRVSLARDHHRQAMALLREIGYRLGIADSLESHAKLATADGELKRAARLWGATSAL